MGGGASAARGRRYAPEEEEGRRQAQRKQSPGTQLDAGQLDTIQAEARSPEWAKPDVFIFQRPDDQSELTQRTGRFYSRNSRVVGTWRMVKNILTLVWEHSSHVDTLKASENEYFWANDETRLRIRVVTATELPWWFMPEVVSNRYEAEGIPQMFYECAVCFFDLYRFPVGVLRKHSRRACTHFFHVECARFLISSSKSTGDEICCPTCKAHFTDVKKMPDLNANPRDWFVICDTDFGGSLDRSEVIAALGAVLPIERQTLQITVKNAWHIWDPDGDGSLTLNEFTRPESGLKDWIMSRLRSLESGAVRRDREVPELDTHPQEWFEYWDRDLSGSLDLDELRRAIVRTFCTAPHQAHDVRRIVDALWATLGYQPFETLTFEEFRKPYGLMDNVVHNNIHGRYMASDLD